MTSLDEQYMRLALKLAARGAGWVSPNPLVGAVVVRDGHIVGRGWHRRYGASHAEVEALLKAGDAARGATLYVTLEPCNHHGRTPPCTQAVLTAGIRRVVAASADPNPRVTGGGADFLRGKGVQVEVGLLDAANRLLNAAWFKWTATGLPYVMAKAACSLDGRIATRTGQSQWLTGEAARVYGHRLRHECDAILVGLGTVLADDPQLTARLGQKGSQTPPPSPLTPDRGLGGEFEGRAGELRSSPGPPLNSSIKRGKDPIRIVLDSRLRIPLEARLLHLDSPAPTWIAATEAAPVEKIEAIRKLGHEVLVLPAEDGQVALKPLLKILGERKVQSLLLEGGAAVLGSFFDQRLVDRFYFFFAPKILGGKDAYPAIAGRGADLLADAHQAHNLTLRRLGPDVLISGDL
jgi:diaminohydroxyphosphoribosylaminopyrimidine deaminase/5-amino-6-(5-phosphoribosylamino)uracil reductase